MIEYTGTWLIPYRAGISNRQGVVLGGKTSRKCGITFSRLRGFAFEGNESRYARTMNFQIYFSRQRSIPRQNLIPRFPLIFTRTTTSRRSFGAAQSAISHVLDEFANSTRSKTNATTSKFYSALFPHFPARNRLVVAFARRSIGLRIGSSVGPTRVNREDAFRLNDSAFFRLRSTRKEREPRVRVIFDQCRAREEWNFPRTLIATLRKRQKSVHFVHQRR